MFAALASKWLKVWGWGFVKLRYYEPQAANAQAAITICSSQSKQAMLTSLVALMLIPQQGQMYLRVLLFFVVVKDDPLCVPVPVI